MNETEIISGHQDLELMQMTILRVAWIDMLKGFAIFLVLLGHTTLTNKTLNHYIFSFHMPLFFFISGFFFKASDTPFRKFLLKRIRTRLVPYFSFGLLTYFIWVLPYLLKKYGVYQGSHAIPDDLFYKPMIGIVYGIGDTEWLPFSDFLWFLACLFVTEIIFFFICSNIKAKRTVLLVLLLSGLLGYIDSIYSRIRLPFSIDVAFTAVVLYGLGYLLRDNLLNADIGIDRALVCLFFGLGIGFLNGRVDMNVNCYGNPLLFYASSISSIYAYVAFAKRLPNVRLISFVGQNSLIFFLLQGAGFTAVNILAYLILRARPNSLEPNLFYALIYVLLTMLVLFPAVFIINRRLPIITGRVQERSR